MALSSNEWAAEIAKRVGRRVARYRAQVPGEKTKPGITAQALADRCTDLGMPMDRTVIAKLEKGTRQTITVGEVIVLARALGVPPVALLFGLGEDESTEILPEKSSDTWEALKWFTGESDQLPGDRPTSEAERGAEPIRLFRRHDQLVADWQKNNRQLQEAFGSMGLTPESSVVQMAAQGLRQIGESLQEVRRDMRRRALAPPPLIPELAYVDAPEDAPTYTPLPEEDQP
jgi:transcriptional regulator with XRE-family HTH domain